MIDYAANKTQRSVTVVQVSDTHLSRRRAYFQANWESFLALMAEDPPDLVVHTGDLCFAANAEPDDLVFGASQMERLGVPWRIVPGNHDVGEIPPDTRRGHPITPEKRGAWRAAFGPDWWEGEIGSWRLIGINAQLMGSGLAAEAEQWDWLETVLSPAVDTKTSDGRPCLLFSHKAPFLGDPADPREHDSAIRPAPRRRLLDLVARAGVGHVACGHNHVYQTARHAGARYVWAPPTSFINRLPKPGAKRGAKRVPGFIRYTLTGRRLKHELIEPPRFIRYDMTNWQRTHGSTTKLPSLPLKMGG